MGSIPAIPIAQCMPSLLCHEWFNEVSLPACVCVMIKSFLFQQLNLAISKTHIRGWSTFSRFVHM
jgi:hypothetical protein